MLKIRIDSSKIAALLCTNKKWINFVTSPQKSVRGDGGNNKHPDIQQHAAFEPEPKHLHTNEAGQRP